MATMNTDGLDDCEIAEKLVDEWADGELYVNDMFDCLARHPSCVEKVKMEVAKRMDILQLLLNEIRDAERDTEKKETNNE